MNTHSLCFSLLLLVAPVQAIEIFVGTPIESTFTDSNRVALLEFDTVKGKIYQIEYSTDMSEWNSYGNSFVGSGNFTSQTVSGRGEPSVYFRLNDNANADELGSVQPRTRKWERFLATNRELGKVYTNSEEYDIEIFVSTFGIGGHIQCEVVDPDTESLILVAYSRVDEAVPKAINATIPAGWDYLVTVSDSLGNSFEYWNEFR